MPARPQQNSYQKKQAVITARVLVEPGSESEERQVSYVVQALKTACKHVRDGSVTITLFDGETNEILGVDVSGTLSEERQKALTDFFGSAPQGLLTTG